MSEAPATATYIDRFGKLHSAAVFENWSPRMIEIMRIKPASPKGKGEGGHA